MIEIETGIETGRGTGTASEIEIEIETVQIGLHWLDRMKGRDVTASPTVARQVRAARSVASVMAKTTVARGADDDGPLTEARRASHLFVDVIQGVGGRTGCVVDSISRCTAFADGLVAIVLLVG